MSEWQPIETAPKDGTRFLAPSIDSKTITIGRWEKTGEYWDDLTVGHLNKKWKPKHWQPLPEPPEGET